MLYVKGVPIGLKYSSVYVTAAKEEVDLLCLLSLEALKALIGGPKSRVVVIIKY